MSGAISVMAEDAQLTGDESVDGNDGLPRAEGSHGDQRHGQKGQGSRSGAGHRQAAGEESKTRERPQQQAKPKAREDKAATIASREIRNPIASASW